MNPELKIMRKLLELLISEKSFTTMDLFFALKYFETILLR